MAEALIKGLIDAQLFSRQSILVREPSQPRGVYLHDTYALTLADSAADIFSSCTTVVLAVKPQVMTLVLQEAAPHITSDHLLVTIAAGLPLSFYEDAIDLEGCRIIRVMPNTPALVQQAASALCGNIHVQQKDIELTQSLLTAIGSCVVVGESYMDSVTGLSGSGPAYVFSFIEALTDAGVKAGLPADISKDLVLQTIAGSVELMRQRQAHPAVLRSQVTSPGGTTIAGLQVLEKAGFQGIIMEAVEAAVQRSIELGSK